MAGAVEITVAIRDLNFRTAQQQLKAQGIATRRDREGLSLRDPDGVLVRIVEVPEP
jgi:hypothetical protein